MTDQEFCEFLRRMDVEYGTRPESPLHHDGRCPVHPRTYPRQEATR